MSLRNALPDTIETPRTVLRQPDGRDLASLVAGANNWKIIEPTASLPYPYLEEHCRGFIERFSRKPDKRTYVIADKASDLAMGVVGLSFAENTPAELGYWLAEPHWGQGLAPEAVAALLAVAGEIGIHVIWARVLESNPASRRVLEKTGFSVVEHTFSVVERHRGKPLLILEWQR